MKITPDIAKSLLRRRHQDDIFVNELGFQFEGSHFRMDSWAMIRCSNLIVAYEIKVDRSDFLNDKKWHNYRAASNELYFVCPWEMIVPEELPSDVGLIWVTKTGNRLVQKKNCIRHDMNKTILESCLKSILFNRATVDPNHRTSAENKREFFEQWLKKKKLDWKFGSMVSKSISRAVSEKIQSVEWENDRLKREVEELKEFKDFLIQNTGLGNDCSIFVLIQKCREKFSFTGTDKEEWIAIKNIAERVLRRS